MELGEVVNPHYAFPVVGVILCVLLVFAFGFKSPVQPPSFDSLEEEKKAVPKKRSKTSKSKENNKVKSHQNGRIGGSPTTKQLPESMAQQNASNSMALDKHNNKVEPKNKKVRSSPNTPRQKLEQSEMTKTKAVTNSEDNAEAGGWVQQLSKKERKHRRKEEVANACVIIETDKNSDSGTWDEHQAIAELSSGSQMSTPLKGSPKQDAKNGKASSSQQSAEDTEVQKNLKKKPKKDGVLNHTEFTSIPEKYEELPKKNKEVETEQYNEIPNTSIDIPNETTEESSGSEDKAKKKKGKKKTQDTNTLSDKSTPDQDFTSKRPISLVDTIESKRDSSKTVKNNITDAAAATEDSTSINDVHTSNPKHEDTSDAVVMTERGSNVAFDELGDIWQDAKSLKKKKKVRREQ